MPTGGAHQDGVLHGGRSVAGKTPGRTGIMSSLATVFLHRMTAA
jgi:hypothetical protein